jgi:hypothetical protein
MSVVRTRRLILVWTGVLLSGVYLMHLLHLHRQILSPTSLSSSVHETRMISVDLGPFQKKTPTATHSSSINNIKGSVTRRFYRADPLHHATNHSSSNLPTSSFYFHRPPLSSLIDTTSGNISGDVQFLLQFAIVGFGKSGTTTVLQLLADHAQVACVRDEIWELMHSQPASLVKLLYQQLPSSPHLQKCYKCPGEITEPHILDYYRRYWPQTKLIVGIRHPVPWFVSLYNFRLQNSENHSLVPHPNQLIGRCFRNMHLMCTEKANFAYALLRLGKHNDPELLNQSRRKSQRRYNSSHTASDDHLHNNLTEAIVGHFRRTWYNVSEVAYHPNPVFLYETTQLRDPQNSFRNDLQQFLGLDAPLAPRIPLIRPGKDWHNDTVQRAKNALQLTSLCGDEYAPVRQELMRLSKLSSRWLRQEFIRYPSVTVSGGVAQMDQLLAKWEVDPCDSD